MHPSEQQTSTKEETASTKTSTNLTLHLTDECNLRCSYCFVRDKAPRAMSFETANTALSWAAQSGHSLVSVIFFGGEPLLCFDLLVRIVQSARRLTEETGTRFTFGMTSNGTLITEEIAAFLNAKAISLHFSIDGAPQSQDMHRRRRDGTGSSALLLKKMPIIRALARTPSVRMTVTCETVRHLFENIEYLVEQGFRSIAPVPVIEIDWNEEMLTLLHAQMEKVAGLYIHHALRCNSLRIKQIDDGMQFLTGRRRKKYPCGIGRNTLSVDPNGNIWPCHRFVANPALTQFCMGRVENLGSIDRKHYEDLTVESMGGCQSVCDSLNTKVCKACEIRNHCGGGCPAVNATCSGTLQSPPPNSGRLNALFLDIANRTGKTLTDLALPLRSNEATSDPVCFGT